MTLFETDIMNKADAWIAGHRGELVEDIKKLVRIKSVNDAGSDVEPYGQGCRDVIDRALEICAGYGFETKNHGYRCCTAILPGTGEGAEQRINADAESRAGAGTGQRAGSGTGQRAGTIGIFNHIDVVPEGNDWTFPPYEPFEKDGYVTGRGSSDNKGPSVASLFTLRCLRDIGVTLKHDALLFLGAAEEVGMDDVGYFLENNPAPKFSFTPDSMYSVCHGEKGILCARFARNIAGGNLVSFKGGQITNSVADRAEAVIKGVSLEAARKAVSGYDKVTARVCDDVSKLCGGDVKILISAVGVAKHAAFPDGSVNAIQLLARVLSEQSLATGPALSAMKFIASAFADNYGAGLDIASEDDVSGATSCIGGLAWMDGSVYHQDINVRYAIKTDVAQLRRNLSTKCAENGFTLTLFNDSKPCYTPADSPLVLAMDRAVGEFYGDRFKPYIMGGGTYARKLPNAVGFGPETDEHAGPFNGAHQPDEAVSIDVLLNAIKINLLALIRLDALL